MLKCKGGPSALMHLFSWREVFILSKPNTHTHKQEQQKTH